MSNIFTETERKPKGKMVTVDNGRLEHTSKVFVDGDGMGRILTPKLMVQALGLKKGDAISQTCHVTSKKIIIKPMGGGGHG